MVRNREAHLEGVLDKMRLPGLCGRTTIRWFSGKRLYFQAIAGVLGVGEANEGLGACGGREIVKGWCIGPPNPVIAGGHWVFGVFNPEVIESVRKT
jgi:hypothetical protein